MSSASRRTSVENLTLWKSDQEQIGQAQRCNRCKSDTSSNVTIFVMSSNVTKKCDKMASYVTDAMHFLLQAEYSSHTPGAERDSFASKKRLLHSFLSAPDISMLTT